VGETETMKSTASNLLTSSRINAVSCAESDLVGLECQCGLSG